MRIHSKTAAVASLRSWAEVGLSDSCERSSRRCTWPALSRGNKSGRCSVSQCIVADTIGICMLGVAWIWVGLEAAVDDHHWSEGVYNVIPLVACGRE